MRYLGSKAKLLSHIERVLLDNNITGENFTDLFAGTGCVGDYFKDRYRIISNDFLYYSYVMNCAKLKNAGVPSFRKFVRTYNTDIFEWLNSLSFDVDDSFFIYKNYTPAGGRMFFTEENGIKIDGIRKKIEELFVNEIITSNEYYFLLASLMESITKISNTSGTFEAYFKFWESRSQKCFEIQPFEINEVDAIQDNIVYCEDANKLVRNIEGDIVYIDTPYTVTQYVSAYHMLETIARYDSPEIKGVGGKRGRGDKNSLYAQRTKAKDAFEDLFRQLQFKHVLISYSNQGLVPVDELCKLARLFAVNNEVRVYHFDYQEYQNHRSSNKRNGEKLNEVIIYFEKDCSIKKSPLNYSGSKDTLIPQILKKLPPHIDTFVDVMGGAFNVGANVVATRSVIYNEINKYVYEIVEMLLTEDRDHVVEEVESIIEQYSLTKAGKDAYDLLRNDYNNNQRALLLYVLHMYSFQNMIRFNGNHKFNTPIGVAGYSEDIKKRIIEFGFKSPSIFMVNSDYTTFIWDQFPEGTVFYFDPPYFITSAAYNDGKRGMKGWSINEELELLRTLKQIDEHGYLFMLSNVVEHKGKEHTLLLQWVRENGYNITEIGTSGWRYVKNEVIITNY